MKIAYVVPYVPNLIRTRPYNLITHLAALGHEVTVFTLGSGEQDLRDVEALRSKVKDVYYQEQPIWYSLWNGLTVLLSRRPLQTVYSWNPRLAKQLVSLLSVPGAFDILHVEHLRGSRYGQYVKSKLPDFPVIWDSVDCISYLFKQASAHSTGGFGKFVTRFELGRTQYMEGKLVGEFDHVLVTSETDKRALLELAPPDSKLAPISVLSNGVDLDYFHPNPDIEREPETLVFSGKMSHHANISMVKYLVSEIMPRVWAKRPQVKLVVVGKDPTPEIRSLGSDPRIEVTGTVDDIRPYLWKATVAVVPLVYGAGIQNKILEAMACGTPVVTTTRATFSLQGHLDNEILIADTSDEFSSKVLHLMDDLNFMRQTADLGFGYVKQFYDWNRIALQLTDIYRANIYNFDASAQK